MAGQPPVFTLITLKKRSEFLRLNGKSKWITPRFILLSAPQTSPGPARFGFTVTKKVGNAVVRNRTKRRFREAVRAMGGSYAQAGHDYVLIARDGALQCDHDTLLRDLQFALSRIHRAPRRSSSEAIAHNKDGSRSEAAGPDNKPKEASA